MKRFDYNNPKHQAIGIQLALMFIFEGNFGELMNPFEMNAHELRESIEKEFEIKPAEPHWNHNHNIWDWLNIEGPRFQGISFLKLVPDSLHLGSELGHGGIATRLAENEVEVNRQKASAAQNKTDSTPKSATIDPRAPKVDAEDQIPEIVKQIAKKLGGKVVSVTTVKLEK